MTKQDLINKIAGNSKLTKTTVTEILDKAFETIIGQLSKGEKVTLTGFGTFSVSSRKARSGVNPRNPKERISIPATKTAHFKAGKTLKERVR